MPSCFPVHTTNNQTCECAVCLRMQIDPTNKDFAGMSPERAFADFALSNSLLHLVIWNFMG